MTRRAIVLAGGRGSRLAPYTTVLPKPLMPVGERPILEILLRQLGAAGSTTSRWRSATWPTSCAPWWATARRTECRSATTRRTARSARPGRWPSIADLDATFVMLNGDVLTTLDFRALVRAHQDAGNELTIATHRRTVRADYGVLHTDGGSAPRTA